MIQATVNFSQEDKEKIIEIAEDRGLSFSSFIRMILKSEIKNSEVSHE